MPYKFTSLAISDVILIEPKMFLDERGSFAEIYKASEFKANGIDTNFVQNNYSVSKKGVIRELHYQKNPNGQGKLVRVTQGKIFDVAVDIRQNSSTFGKWVSSFLSADNHAMLWVPSGFAHGFCAIEENTQVVYKISSSEYSPQHERFIIWNDADIQIQWPIEYPDLSEKDRLGKCLRDLMPMEM